MSAIHSVSIIDQQTKLLSWPFGSENLQACWRSESGVEPPAQVMDADDSLSVNQAYKLMSEGVYLIWRGDYHNGRQLLQGLSRKLNRPPRNPPAPPLTAQVSFERHRANNARRAAILSKLLLLFSAEHQLANRRAPNVRNACSQAFGEQTQPYLMAYKDLLGVIGAFEWRKNGVPIPALGNKTIHPHYGVFSPVRGEYIKLVLDAPLKQKKLAFDIGTGSGILSLVLAKRGMKQIIATDISQRALACAAENAERLGFDEQIQLEAKDLFPEGKAPLIVCNPPWVPAQPTSLLEYAVYDPDSQMLRSFLAGLSNHLTPEGEAWLILSDLAEHLGLRSRQTLLSWFDEAGLIVIGRIGAKPQHPKAQDPNDPLHQARAKEVTSLWRLALASPTSETESMPS